MTVSQKPRLQSESCHMHNVSAGYLRLGSVVSESLLHGLAAVICLTPDASL